MRCRYMRVRLCARRMQGWMHMRARPRARARIGGGHDYQLGITGRGMGAMDRMSGNGGGSCHSSESSQLLNLDSFM